MKFKSHYYHTLSMVGVKVDPSPYKCMVNLHFFKLHNLGLMHPISLKLQGNAQDYDTIKFRLLRVTDQHVHEINRIMKLPLCYVKLKLNFYLVLKLNYNKIFELALKLN